MNVERLNFALGKPSMLHGRKHIQAHTFVEHLECQNCELLVLLW